MDMRKDYNNLMEYKIKTSYSTETYYSFDDIDQYLIDNCYCDNYKVVSSKKASKKVITRYIALINALRNTDTQGYKFNNIMLCFNPYLLGILPLDIANIFE